MTGKHFLGVNLTLLLLIYPLFLRILVLLRVVWWVVWELGAANNGTILVMELASAKLWARSHLDKSLTKAEPKAEPKVELKKLQRFSTF